MPNPFTTARESVWNAINNWPALTGKFARKKDYVTLARNIENATSVSLADLSAIEILPGNTQIAWDTNRMEKVDYVLNVGIMGLALPTIEQLATDVWDAIYNAKPPGGAMSYVRTATGYNPMNLQVSWAVRRSTDSGQKLTFIQATIFVGIRFQRDPFGRT